jgi:hypothetical protein
MMPKETWRGARATSFLKHWSKGEPRGGKSGSQEMRLSRSSGI